MQTVSPTSLYNLGYAIGARALAGTIPQTALVVLDWGAPYCSSASNCGTTLFSGAYQTTNAELAAAEQFGLGFYTGSGVDVTARVFVAMGTSNNGSWMASGSNAFQHGVAWANMVTNGNNWLQTNGYISQVQLRAAIDAEQGWNTYPPTRQWAVGYTSVSTTYFWNFGSASGCPPIGTCNNGWTQADIHEISYGFAPAEPLPEIYNQSTASEWAAIANSNYMQFLGAMSQWQACADQGSSCVGEDFTPTAVWNALYTSLNCSGCAAQTPPHVTDIRWKLLAN